MSISHRTHHELRIMAGFNAAIFIAIAMLFGPHFAFANGAPYAPGFWGGIEMRHSDTISIESETLRISPTLVEVNYVFHSTAKETQDIDILFPVPPYIEDDAGWLDSSIKPKVSSNGNVFEPEKHTYIDAYDYENNKNTIIDITQYLENDSHIMKTDAYHALNKKYQLDSCGDDGGKTCLYKGLLMQSFIWKQKFPPGETRITVTYPSAPAGDYYLDPDKLDAPIKHGFGPQLQTDERNLDPTYRELYCIDEAFENALKKIHKKVVQEHSPIGMGFGIFYLWENARYWQGPIKNFHLIIEKQDPRQLVSYCPVIGEKTSPTRFEWKTSNFVPQGRLRVLYYNPPELVTELEQEPEAEAKSAKP